MEIDKSCAKPLYAQLEDLFRVAIHNKDWEVDHAIPSEIELSNRYKVSRMTVRAAITRLVMDGLLYRVQGKGTFVARPKIAAQSLAYMGIREQLEHMGYQTSTALIHHENIVANARIAKILGIRPGEEVTFIERVRSIGDEPISIHRSYIPVEFTGNFSINMLETEQLCVLLENQYGLKSKFVEETLESVLATAAEAEMLSIGRNYPLLLLEDINMTSTRRPFEFSQVLFRGNKIKLHFEYNNGI